MTEADSPLRCGLPASRDWSEFAPTLPYRREQPSPGRRLQVKGAGEPAEPGRAISASLELMAQVWPTRHERANKFSAGVCPVQGHGCECGARAKPLSRGVGGGRTLSRKRTQKSVLALGRLISFGFRKKRHQADSRDAALTSTPTTTISATGGRAFFLPSKQSDESFIMFTTADISLRYPSPFHRSLQYEIQH